MGFNYLQTDDRDDYFSQFGGKGKKHPIMSMTLIDPFGKTIFSEVPMFKIRTYAKKTYLELGQSGKKIWRKLLEGKGYKIINNY